MTGMFKSWKFYAIVAILLCGLVSTYAVIRKPRPKSDKPEDIAKFVASDGFKKLSDDEQKMVFNRFYKKDKFQQGTGLGLSICKAMAIRLGGDMDVRSRLGQGTRFTLYCQGGVRNKEPEVE